ncbi:hypothetical protein E3N88_11564 [Mikania micrantha]|uniref:CCHC-type domain-containing protein n=1 Tax=Mikania micrantha TaxID=192012 RepID=A0A5N6PE49_9ASTR|nr:hypothetical protein E3N88_11564 [Mikania micrantha]
MDVANIIWYSLLGFLIIFSLVCLIYWRKFFFIYDHRFLFVVGLVFSRSLAYYAIVDNLMWYFIDHDVPFVKSTVFANIQESLSSVFVILMAHSADSFVGRFRTILFSSTAFICGIMLLLIFNPYDVTWLAVIILVLLALGRSGDNLLENILADLVNEADKSEDRNKKRSEARAALWHRIPHASGAISATLWVAPYALVRSHSTWNSAFFICLISMTTTLMIFCKGHGVYCQGKLTHRPVEIFYRVIRARIHKLLCNSKSRCSTYDTSSQGRSLERNVENDEPIRPATRGEIEQRNNRVYKEDVRVIRSLLRMFPLWGNFFVVSLTSAVGSTFYIEQYNNLENKYHIPVQIYDVTQSFSHFIVPFLYQLTCFSGNNQKLKIGVGILCSILSCVFAWQLEVHRLRKLKNMVDDDEIPISFLWLVPQFVMLGFMEGLTQKGMLKFFKSQVEKPVKNYGEEYMELVMSLGKLANVVLVLILNAQTDWFRVYTNNVPRLNMYYLLLFDRLIMKDDESVDSFTLRLTSIVSKVTSCGATIDQPTLVRKFLTAMPDRFLQIIASIEQFSNLDTLTLDDVIRRLKTYEERIKYRKGTSNDSQGKLLFTKHDNKKGHGKRFGNQVPNRFNSSQKNRRDDKGKQVDKDERSSQGSYYNKFKKTHKPMSKVRCYNCKERGHYSKRALKRKSYKNNIT